MLSLLAVVLFLWKSYCDRGSIIQQRVRKKRKVSFSDERQRPRSRSLDDILEEVYCDVQSLGDRTRFIPRAKLARTNRRSVDETQYPSLSDMSRRPQVLRVQDSATTARSNHLNQLHSKIVSMSATSLPFLEDDTNSGYETLELAKHNENYFTRNFEECMKQLELMEREQKRMEEHDREEGKSTAEEKKRKSSKRQMTPTSEIELPPAEMAELRQGRKEEPKQEGKEEKEETAEDEEEVDGCKSTGDVINVVIIEPIDLKTKTPEPKPQEGGGWYINLKKQFEELDKDLREKEKEVATCRITGAMLKNKKTTEEVRRATTEDVRRATTEDIRRATTEEIRRATMEDVRRATTEDVRRATTEEEHRDTSRKPERTLSTPVIPSSGVEETGKEKRHYFSSLVKSSKSLIDEELPDPDKVHNIRAMFQEQLRLRQPQDRWGGSLQNISTNAVESKPERPQSAQGGRVIQFEGKTEEIEEEVVRATNSSSVPPWKRGHDKESQTETEKSEKKYQEEKDPRRTRWTDIGSSVSNGSMSSGVSSALSDLSSCDLIEDWLDTKDGDVSTVDTQHVNQGSDEPKHYVRHDILERIRSFGTSVTYFGGEMITCSVGPILSPTTQAIMEEIGHKCPNGRSFDQFYRKYTEANEQAMQKKLLARTRSFGQNDLFQKPNVLNDAEIEIYKNDLETEFGIRRPRGRQQGNVWRNRLTKSHSLGVCTTVEEIDKNGNTDGSDFGDEKRMDQIHGMQQESEETDSTDRSQINNEITFGYDAKLLNMLKKTDMEFEEFQVAETAAEKIERIEESLPDYRVTIQINHEHQEVPRIEIQEPFEEIVIPEMDQPDSLEIYLKHKEEEAGQGEEDEHIVIQPKRKWNINLNQETTAEINNTAETQQVQAQIHAIPKQNTNPKTETTDKENKDSDKSETESDNPDYENVIFRTFDINRNIDMDNRKSLSKSLWPIETTVVIDIQQQDITMPKILTTKEAKVKTKKRLF